MSRQGPVRYFGTLNQQQDSVLQNFINGKSLSIGLVGGLNL